VALDLQLAADGIELIEAMGWLPWRQLHAHGLRAPWSAVRSSH
jgi:hypothetical protein